MFNQETKDIEVNAEPGTGVQLQATNTLDFHDGVVGEEGKVRNAENGAVFQQYGYDVVDIND